MWGIVILINACSPYDWFDLSEDTCLLLLLVSVAMCFALLPSRPLFKFRFSTRIDVENRREDVPKLFFGIQVFLLLVTLPIVVKAIRLAIKYDFDLYYVRHFFSTAGEADSMMNTFERLFYIHYVVFPCLSACEIIDMILYVKFGFWKKPLIFMILAVGVQTICKSGRLELFAISLIMICIFSYSRRKGKSSINYKKIRGILIIFAIVAASLTFLRAFSTDNWAGMLIKTVVTYFGGGIRVLDRTIQDPSQYGLDSYSLGICSFGGIVSILFTFNHYFLGLFGINIFPEGFSTQIIHNAYLSQSVQIGTAMKMNAFPTMLYYFLRDGGVIWAILFTGIFVRLVMRAEDNYLHNPTIKNGFLLFFLLYNAVMSVCWWNPMNCEFWMEMFWGLGMIGLMKFNTKKSLSTAPCFHENE